MEPFSITCTTCQAKLKVRSAAAIGQILSCPKCESMVQVLAPPGWHADEAPASDSSTAQPHRNTHADSSATSKAATTPDAIPAANSPPASPPVDDLTSAVADASAAFEDLSHLQTGSASPTPPPMQLPPLSADWASPTETLGRKVALYAVAGGTTAVVLCLAIAYLLSGSDPPVPADSVAVADADPAKSNTDTSEAATEPETAANDTAVPAESPETKPMAVETLLPPAEKEVPKEPAEVKETPPAVTPETPTPNEKQPEKSADLAETPTEAGTQTSEGNSDSESSIDAAKLLADASLETLLPQEAPSPDAALTVPAPEMTEEELAAAAEAAAAAAPEEDHSASSGVDLAPSASVRRIPNESTAPVQPAEEILRLQLPQLTFRNVPLALLLGELSDLSTLPITFDLVALSAAQISPDVAVSVSASDKTLAEILTTTLASQKLTYYTNRRQVVVTTPAALAAARTVRFSVDDLAQGEDQLRELAALIIKMVAPESWAFAGGPGKMEVETDRLSLEQTGSVIFEAVVFCERLRTARGLATRSRVPENQLQLVSARVQAKSHLARNVACTFHAPTRLTDVVRYLEELSGAKIFIDWRSLDHVQLTPQDTITCALPEQPLSSALDALLTPLGLGYRVVDKGTLEVFALQNLPTKMTREFYPLNSLLEAGVNMEVLLTAIQKLTGEDAWAPESTGLYFFDPVSKHLIVRHGNRVHGQIEHLLDEAARKLAGKKSGGGKG